MAMKDWKKGAYTFERDGFIRYFGGSKRFEEMQISKYRDADEFDSAMNQKYNWHGKWYVDIFGKKGVKLFKTQTQSIAYAKNYMRKH